ncbi:MAG: hypothetical protein R3250_05920 [Melioribacteraceae bacterium]|nr:hypothetical protein [Melioribacteraceae bacterium]
MTISSTLKIDSYIVKSNRNEIRRIKVILDKLEVPHVVDNISFNNTSADLNLMKALNKTNVWKVEKDGSLSLANRFGHSGNLAYRELVIESISEFRFVNLYSLSRDEGEFLADLLCKFEYDLENQISNEKQKVTMH